MRGGCGVLGDERLRFRASDGDPIGTTHRLPRRFDSRLEERFFRDLGRLAPEIAVLREADPGTAGGATLVPDFTLVLPATGQRVAVEIVGFWKPAYLEKKLRAVAALPPDLRWVICVDVELAAGDKIPARHPVFRFKHRIDASAFLAFLGSTGLMPPLEKPGRG